MVVMVVGDMVNDVTANPILHVCIVEKFGHCSNYYWLKFGKLDRIAHFAQTKPFFPSPSS